MVSVSLVGGGKFQITTQISMEASRDTPALAGSTRRVSWGSRVWGGHPAEQQQGGNKGQQRPLFPGCWEFTGTVYS